MPQRYALIDVVVKLKVPVEIDFDDEENNDIVHDVIGNMESSFVDYSSGAGQEISVQSTNYNIHNVEYVTE